MKTIDRIITRKLASWVAFRRRLHAHPELAYSEHATADAIAKRLERLPGMRLRRHVGRTGLVADYNAASGGPALALRADMDALPIQEAAARPYRSRKEGLMHACGHDGHVACLVGAAEALALSGIPLPGPVRFIFQPAEEDGAGALRMIEDGALEGLDVRAIFALHGVPLLPVGVADVRDGTSFASTDTLDIRIEGAGTHAASPHRGVDPVVAASAVVGALQSVVSRNISPTESLVITIGAIHGGTARNVIPSTVTLKGTVRTLNAATRQLALKRIPQVVEHTAAAYGATAEVCIGTGYPVLNNAAHAVDHLMAAATGLEGLELRRNSLPPSLGGEDFAYFLERVPGALWRLGLIPAGQTEMPPLHHPGFDFTDAAIAAAVRLHCATVMQAFCR